ncbi:MAG: hypothetical protein ACAH95_13935, partial [Fimbriimonas sp.]
DEAKFSSALVARAALKLASTPNAGMDVIGTAMEEVRTAGLTVTEESCITKRVTCTLADLGNIDPKDPSFVDAFRQTAIQALQDAGQQIDPNTFTFTNLTVGPMGDVSAETSSRVSKTFKLDGAPAAGGFNDATDSFPGEENGPADAAALPADRPSDMNTETDHVMTPSADLLAKAARGEGGLRIAQMMGGGGAAPMGGAPMGGAAPMGDPMGGAAPMGGDAGLSSLTVPSETGAPGTEGVGEEPDADGMSEPGATKPFGTVCPQCGSIDTDVAGNHGKCNSQECGAEWDIEMMIKMTDDGSAKDEAGDAPVEDPAAAPGLGDMTAPAPDMGAGAPPAGGAPAPAAPGANVMASIWWQSPVAPFVRLAAAAREGKEREARIESDDLPAGYICLSCANRNPDTLEKIASKDHSKSFCGGCGQVLISKNPEFRVQGGKRIAAKAGHVWNNVVWIAHVESLD